MRNGAQVSQVHQALSNPKVAGIIDADFRPHRPASLIVLRQKALLQKTFGQLTTPWRSTRVWKGGYELMRTNPSPYGRVSQVEVIMVDQSAVFLHPVG